MKKIVTSILIALSIVFLTSCATSNSTTTTLNGFDLSKYEYVVFGTESSGDAELDDVIMILQNEISQRLNVVSNSEALSLSYAGTPVLSPRINVKSEKWSGGHTYITINFYDFDKNILCSYC